MYFKPDLVEDDVDRSLLHPFSDLHVWLAGWSDFWVTFLKEDNDCLRWFFFPVALQLNRLRYTLHRFYVVLECLFLLRVSSVELRLSFRVVADAEVVKRAGSWVYWGELWIGLVPGVVVCLDTSVVCVLVGALFRITELCNSKCNR